ncbi:MAG: secretin N-terminal domain-containing protein [Fimbriiglobus sp.]
MKASRLRATSIRLRVPMWRLRRWLPVALLASLGGSVVAVQPPAPPATPPVAKPMLPLNPMPMTPMTPMAQAVTEKTYSYTFDKSSWDAAFTWLEKVTNQRLITTVKPVATVTLKIENKTIPEIVDLFNEALALEKFILVRAEQSFTIFPADEKIPKHRIKKVLLSELPKYGRSEFVTVSIPLKSLTAEGIQPQVKKMLSNFGDIYALGSSQLIIEDTVANIRVIQANLKELDEGGGGSGDSLTHVCKFQRASIVAEQLGKLLKDGTTNVDTSSIANPAAGVPGQPGMPVQNFDPRMMRGGAPAGPDPRFRSVQLTVVEETNTVIMTGPADKINVAEKLIKTIDVAQPGQPERPNGGQMVFSTYNVPSGQADIIATTLKQKFKNSSVVINSIPASNQINVFGFPADQIEISGYLKSLGETKANSRVELVNLTILDQTKVAETLTKAFGSGGLFVEAQPTGGVLLRGSEDQIQGAKEFIKAMGEDPKAGMGALGSPTMRVISLDKASPAMAADGLAELLRKLGSKNPVEVINPSAPKPKSEDKPKVVPTPGAGADEKRSMLPGTPNVLRAQYISQNTNPQEPKKEPAQTGKPLTITVAGDKIILVSEDLEALDRATALLRLLTKPSTGEERFEVIRLKHIAAEEAAKTLDEVFNGTSRSGAAPGGGGGRGGFNPLALLSAFSGGGASAPTSPSAGRIKVVAERTSNSLIVVKASDLDLYTIRKLLEKAIDYDGPPEGGVAKTFTIALTYAKAADVSATLETVFKNLINPSRGGGGLPPGFPFPIPGQQQQAATAPTLTVSFDEISNRIIVFCNEGTFTEVEKLCKELDKATKGSLDVVRVVPITGIAPSEVATAIEALVGKPAGASSRPTNNNPFGGGFSPFGGGGGFQPGGGGGRGSRGTGGGGRGTRGGGFRSDPGSPEGRDPFDYPGMDARPNFLYDPETDGEPQVRTTPDNGVRQVAAQEPAAPMLQPPPKTGAMGNPSETAQQPVPSGDVVVTPIDGLSTLIIRGRTKEDIDAILQFIKILEASVKDAEIELVYVTLKSADATEMVNLLTQIYSRLQVAPGSSTIIPAQNNNRNSSPFSFFFGQQQQNQPAATSGSVLIFPLPRLSQVLIAAPKAQLKGILKQIEMLDKPNSELMSARPYLLKRASASVVAQQLNSFFASRFSGESTQQNAIRIFANASNNAVFVQAGEADQREIADLIRMLDTGESTAVNQLKLVKLNNATAAEVAAIINQAISVSVVNPNTTANAGGSTGGTTAQGGFGPINIGGGGLNQQNRAGGQGLNLGGATQNQGTGITTKTTTLRLVAGQDGKPIDSGYLEDVFVVPNERINSVLVVAPEKTMILIERLIKELDTVSAAKSYVNIYQLKKLDATQVANTIRTLFGGAQTGGNQGLNQGGFNQGGLGLGNQGLGQNQANVVNRPLLTLTGNPSDGAQLIGLSISPDTVTNSIIVSGSRNDLDTINAIIARLEDAQSLDVQQQVFKVHHASAADLANTISTFITQQAQLTNAQFNNAAFQNLQRSTVIAAEPVSNQLLVTGTPDMINKVSMLVSQLDIVPMMVHVKVTIAEVSLTNRNEFGVELGLQSPVLFARSTVTQGAGTPGYLFNTTAPLANGNLAQQSTVGFQGLGSLGVGRGANGVGGFVFSAASDTVSVLIRALHTQGRAQILSTPTLLLTDNQQGFFQVGQKFPLLGGSTLAGTGAAQQDITYADIGIVLRVTPRIDPNGRVLMRIEPSVSSPNPNLVPLGNGVQATIIDNQTVQTTVSAEDGETIIIGGLIRKSDSNSENKIPILGDLPWVGAAFRYRVQDKQRRELMFIVTPQIIRGTADLARISAEQARQMSWGFRDVAEQHGYGANVLSGQAAMPQNGWNQMLSEPYYMPNGQGQPIFNQSTGQMVSPQGMMNPGQFVAPQNLAGPNNPALQTPASGQPTYMPSAPTGAIPLNAPRTLLESGPVSITTPNGPISGGAIAPGQLGMGVVQGTPMPAPARPTTINGFPLVNKHGDTTVFNPNPPASVQPAAATTPAPQTKEGPSWSVFGR